MKSTNCVPEAPTEEASEIQRLFNEPVAQRMKIAESFHFPEKQTENINNCVCERESE